jgi:hypothetical protein
MLYLLAREAWVSFLGLNGARRLNDWLSCLVLGGLDGGRVGGYLGKIILE